MSLRLSVPYAECRKETNNYAECHYAECRKKTIIANVIMLNVVMLSVIVLIVVAWLMHSGTKAGTKGGIEKKEPEKIQHRFV